MKNALLSVLAALLLSCCTGHSDKTQATVPAIDTLSTLITQVRKCSKLYTTEYHIHKIITHDDQMKFSGTFMGQDFSIDLPAGQRRIAIPMDATLKAYIDFSAFSGQNIKRNGNQITITLPDPQITMTASKISHKEIRKHVPLTRSNFTDAELSHYEQQGRMAIIQSVPDMGLIERARENAARILIPMIAALGYDESQVTIVYRHDLDTRDPYSIMDQTTLENLWNK